jgi:hypothetical protein
MKKKSVLFLAASMLAASGAPAIVENLNSKNTISHLYQYQGANLSQPLPGLYRRRRKKNKFGGGSFMGPGIKRKKSNKIHHSRMLKRKHKKNEQR